ncbi:uncharacterized protein [Narcine bancroftii]
MRRAMRERARTLHMTFRPRSPGVGWEKKRKRRKPTRTQVLTSEIHRASERWRTITRSLTVCSRRGGQTGIEVITRVMDRMVEEHKWTATFPYLNNVTICGHDQRDHDMNLAKFLRKLNDSPDALSQGTSASVHLDHLQTLHDSLCHPGVTRLNHFDKTQNLPYSIEDVRSMTRRCQICAE